MEKLPPSHRTPTLYPTSTKRPSSSKPGGHKRSRTPSPSKGSKHWRHEAGGHGYIPKHYQQASALPSELTSPLLSRFGLLESSCNTLVKYISEKRFDLAQGHISYMDMTFRPEWRYSSFRSLSPQQLSVLFLARGLVDACEWVKNTRQNPDDWCQNLGQPSGLVTRDYFRQMLAFSRYYLAGSHFHSLAFARPRLCQALAYLEWIKMCQSLHGPMRAIWLDNYVAICHELDQIHDAAPHPQSEAWAIIKPLLAEIDRRMARQPDKDPTPALECLQQTLHRVRDEGFREQSLLVLCCAARYVSKKYIQTLNNQERSRFSLPVKLNHVYYYSATLLLFSALNSEHTNYATSISNLGRLRVPFERLGEVMGILVSDYHHNHMQDNKMELERHWIWCCCLVPDNDFMQVLAQMTAKNYGHAQTLLDRLKAHYAGDRDKLNLVHLAKAWCHFRQQNLDMAKKHMQSINTPDDSALGFQRLLLLVTMSPKETILPDASEGLNATVEQYFVKWDKAWLEGQQFGGLHEYPAYVEPSSHDQPAVDDDNMMVLSPISQPKDTVSPNVSPLPPKPETTTTATMPLPPEESPEPAAPMLAAEQTQTDMAIEFKALREGCNHMETTIKDLSQQVALLTKRNEKLAISLQKYQKAHDTLAIKNKHFEQSEKSLLKEVKELKSSVAASGKRVKILESTTQAFREKKVQADQEREQLQQQIKQQQHALQAMEQEREQWQRETTARLEKELTQGHRL